MTDKFNVERLLRSLGFTSELHNYDDKGELVVKKNDSGTSRFYDHDKGYRVELVYDDNKLRQSDNLKHYSFVDFRNNEDKLTDNAKATLSELNTIISSIFDELVDSDISKYINVKPKIDVSVYRNVVNVDKTMYDNEVDYWMAMFDSLGWKFDTKA
jgi:hypothetical protein